MYCNRMPPSRAVFPLESGRGVSDPPRQLHVDLHLLLFFFFFLASLSLDLFDDLSEGAQLLPFLLVLLLLQLSLHSVKNLFTDTLRVLRDRKKKEKPQKETNVTRTWSARTLAAPPRVHREASLSSVLSAWISLML